MVGVAAELSTTDEAKIRDTGFPSVAVKRILRRRRERKLRNHARARARAPSKFLRDLPLGQSCNTRRGLAVARARVLRPRRRPPPTTERQTGLIRVVKFRGRFRTLSRHEQEIKLRGAKGCARARALGSINLATFDVKYGF